MAAAASSGPGGMFSIASAHSFAVLPQVWSAMPSTPANGPRPDRGHEEQREHERVDAAQRVEEPARRVVQRPGSA